MKKITKILSLLLAVAMVLSLNLTTITALAATYTITINTSTTGSNTTSTTHVYEAYQIFAGDYDATEGNLSNITWGSGISDTAITSLLAALNSDNSTTIADWRSSNGDFSTAEDYANYIASLTSNSEDLNKEAERLATYSSGYTYLSSATGSSTYNQTSGCYEITNLSEGYYLVLDQYNSLAGTTGQVYTQYMLKLVGNVTLTPKEDIPTVNKYVDDINDSTGTEELLQETADYDVGDEVPFTLVATLPANYSEYDSYDLTFHDTEATGLTFIESSVVVKVYLDGDITSTDPDNIITLSSGTGAGTYSVVTTNINGETFNVVIDDLKTAAPTATNVSKVVVTYKSTLNSNAVIGNYGNENTVYLEYSNNPYTEETGKTTEKKVVVFTYEVDINKIKSNSDPLTGAGFTLYKKYSSITDPVSTGTTVYYYDESAGTFTLTTAPGTTYRVQVDGTEYYYDGTDYYKIVQTIDTQGTTTFAFQRIDDGTYALLETTTPSGYNTMDPVIFTITAEHKNESGTLKITDLTVTGLTTQSISTDDGLITANIVNYSGTEMPETGGMGTKIFYTLGGILVVGAGILLIVKRRMKNA